MPDETQKLMEVLWPCFWIGCSAFFWCLLGDLELWQVLGGSPMWTLYFFWTVRPLGSDGGGLASGKYRHDVFGSI